MPGAPPAGPEGILDGKVALVTGASRGIGRSIAERFGDVGATVVITARTTSAADQRLPGTVHETADAVRARGGTAVVVPADLSTPEERERLVARAAEEAGPIDILVNNAAVTYFSPVEDFEWRRYDRMLEIQVKAPFHLARLVLPGMRQRGSGWILNISSGAARQAQIPPPEHAAGRGGTVYGMCKAALERFTTGLASEVFADGVAVNALSPNKVVATPGAIIHRLVDPDDPSSGEAPEVMADAALALCCGDPSVLTGRITYSQDLLDELRRAVGPD